MLSRAKLSGNWHRTNLVEIASHHHRLCRCGSEMALQFKSLANTSFQLLRCSLQDRDDILQHPVITMNKSYNSGVVYSIAEVRRSHPMLLEKHDDSKCANRKQREEK